MEGKRVGRDGSWERRERRETDEGGREKIDIPDDCPQGPLSLFELHL